MKYQLSVYIESDETINQIEGIMNFLGFKVVETNKCYRVFLGEYEKNVFALSEYLNTQFSEISFEIEDSLFLTYTSFKDRYKPSLGMVTLKRKGNERLRINQFNK
jgi:hypothetical protein